jgi:ElaB/YqjD/DUF883 family membrane-anchored ribosome-binding protein
MAQKVTKTNAELLELVKALNITPAEKGSKAEAKLKKIAEKIKPLFEQYHDKREDIRLDNAHTESNGVLDLNEKGEYKFTKHGIKGMAKDMKKLLDDTFEFYQFTFSTEGIDSFKFLAGWVEGIEPEQPSQDDEQVL